MANEQENAKLSGSIAGQSFSLQTRDIIPVLLLLVAGVCGYLVYLALDQRLVNMREVQVHILTTLSSNREATTGEYHAMRELHTIQMDYFRKLLTTLDYNMSHGPTERYPLELVPPPVMTKPPPAAP